MCNFGTDALRHLSRKQLGEKYAQVRAAVFATEYGRKFKDAADFDGFVESFQYETGIRRERSKVMTAFGQLSLAHTKTTRIPPSQETLAWGGFLGGSIYHDTKEADAICEALLHQSSRELAG